MSVVNIVAFPLHRRKTLVKGIAKVLASKNGEDANRFWRDTAKTILRQLQTQGLQQGDSEREVRALLSAVMAEIQWNAETATA
ncbi:DUF6074 family protein [Mesorhizobium sp. SB112]|uniref:DUF6074 family protein n=1 Tax=Mesorhizobium sp. SB112 TaxID=3151853 RepID=UPI003265F043